MLEDRFLCAVLELLHIIRYTNKTFMNWWWGFKHFTQSTLLGRYAEAETQNTTLFFASLHKEDIYLHVYLNELYICIGGRMMSSNTSSNSWCINIANILLFKKNYKIREYTIIYISRSVTSPRIQLSPALLETSQKIVRLYHDGQVFSKQPGKSVEYSKNCGHLVNQLDNAAVLMG